MLQCLEGHSRRPFLIGTLPEPSELSWWNSDNQLTVTRTSAASTCFKLSASNQSQLRLVRNMPEFELVTRINIIIDRPPLAAMSRCLTWHYDTLTCREPIKAKCILRNLWMTLHLEDDIPRLCEVASRSLGELNMFDASRIVFGLTSFYLAITLNSVDRWISWCSASRHALLPSKPKASHW